MERMGRTGISCPDIEGACGAAAAGLKLAVNMVEAGQSDIVLAFGVEKMGKDSWLQKCYMRSGNA